MTTSKKIHYGKKYFACQVIGGKIGAKQDLWMYKNLIKPSDTVLDFGCGGGFLLSTINPKGKYGVEINPVAREKAKINGIKVFSYIYDLPKNIKFDKIISHHALEHVENPAIILRELQKKLKTNGKIIVVIPLDDWRRQKAYFKEDINKHLYAWTPLAIGNLFHFVGFKITEVKLVSITWLPLSRYYFDYFPKWLYYFLAGIYSRVILSRQIRVIATL